MTIQQRTTIELSDIVGMECRCGNCQSTYSVPISKFDQILVHCPNCKHEVVGIRYADSGKPNDQTALHTFMQALKDVQSRKIAIRLELAASLARAAFDKD